MTKNKSFTLIELLVVIVIIGILAGVIIVSTSSSIGKANFAKGQVFSSTVKNEMFSNLISEWTFDDIVGVTVGNAIPNGTNIPDGYGISNGHVFGDAKIFLKDGADCVTRKCIYLNGTTGTITVPNNSQIQPIFGSENFALELWVRPERFYNYEGLINKSDSGYYSASSGGLFMDASGLRFIIGTGLDSSTTSTIIYKPVLNEWYHMVGTIGDVNGTKKLKLYINGSLISEITTTFDPSPTTDNLCIGGFYEGVRSLKGHIDEVRIYDKMLSVGRIKQNYIAGINSLLASGSISKEEYDQRLNNLAYDKE